MNTTENEKFNDRGLIVHGHNETIKYEVARFIEKELNIETTILHEQASKGLTIIEKFESYSQLTLRLHYGQQMIREKAREKKNTVIELGKM